MKVKLNVLGISYSQTQSGAYALILAEEGPFARRLPIIIGGNEAQSIAIQLEGLITPRPLTHDLFVSMASTFGISLSEVLIYKLEEGIFFAELLCDNGKFKARIDARTSDAVALALRFKVPVYTTEKIMLRAGIMVDEDETEPQSKQANPLAGYSDEELEEMLNAAIKEEDYETAASITQEINLRKEAENPEDDSQS